MNISEVIPTKESINCCMDTTYRHYQLPY